MDYAQPQNYGGGYMPIQQQPQLIYQAPQVASGTQQMTMQQPQQQYNNPFQGGYQQPRMVRPPRPPGRSVAICYSCGEEGHYARDGICVQENVDRFHAMMRQQAAGLVAGQGGRIAQVARDGATAITYVAAGGNAPGGN
jgi:hypothetical protein